MNILLEGMREISATQNKRMKASEGEAENLRARNTELEQELRDKTKEGDTLKEQAAGLQDKIDGLKGCEPGMGQKVDDMKRQLDRAEQEVHSLREQKSKIIVKQETAEEKLAIATDRIKDAEDKTQAQVQGLEKDLNIMRDLLKHSNPILALDVEKCLKLAREGATPQQALCKASTAFSGSG